jgi:hypothetical protein
VTALAGLRSRGRAISGFWKGLLTFWLGFGVCYVAYRGGINPDTRVAELTLGEIGEHLLLIALWPFEVLGVSIQLSG